HAAAFPSAVVFGARVTGRRAGGCCLQADLCPVDAEMGLALGVDLADLAGVTGGSTEAGFGVIQPGLGSTIAQLRANVRVGTHVFVEVDTSALHAYSVE